jgi:hypothetical protein
MRCAFELFRTNKKKFLLQQSKVEKALWILRGGFSLHHQEIKLDKVIQHMEKFSLVPTICWLSVASAHDADLNGLTLLTALQRLTLRDFWITSVGLENLGTKKNREHHSSLSFSASSLRSLA